MNITASLVLYKNQPEIIKEVIASFFASNRGGRHLYLIDNSPTDMLRSIRDLVPHNITYLFNRKNIGFGAAHNIGIGLAREVNSDYHLILNPDVTFEGHVLPKLADYMGVNQDIGLLSPQVYFPNGERQYLCKLLPNPLDLIIRRFVPIKGYRDRLNKNYELRFWSYDEPADIPSLSGCFMFCRTRTLADIGGFDERYFMYAEDMDLCRRMAAKARVVYYPGVSVIHTFSRGSYHDAKLLKHHVTSVVKYFSKWGWIWDKKRRETNRACLGSLTAKSDLR